MIMEKPYISRITPEKIVALNMENPKGVNNLPNRWDYVINNERKSVLNKSIKTKDAFASFQSNN